PYMARLGVPYHYLREPLMERARRHMDKDSYCSFCARMKRGLFYSLARREGYNVLALGQHLDDLAESFLMSAFYGGRLQTMKAHYVNDAGDVRIIRPLVTVRERQLADFAARAALPVVPDSCPACFRMPTERAHMKALLAGEEARNPRLFRSLLTAMRPLMDAEGARRVAALARETKKRRG
ncbi:MAG: tRNA 2-thiocytidine biosynthesis protein TtcA, partial [Gammaproteobacteria bacterium]